MRDPSDRPGPALLDVLLYLVGVAGLAAGITLLFFGMRAVMDVGGACAEGGPYVIGQRCPEGTGVATLLGIFGGVASLFLAIWKGAAIGDGAVSILFLAWPALFAVLGFNFLEYGFAPPGDDPGWAWGWLVCGVVFEAMAFGPLLLGAWSVRGAGGRPTAAALRAVPGGPRLKATVRDARIRREARRVADAAAPLAAMPEPRGAMPEPRWADAGDAGGDRGAALVGNLERLAALRESGALTADEYARAKADLLEETGA